VRISAHLDRDMDIGWGLIGHLNKGGWIVIDQAPVANGIWHLTRFQMQMTGRVLFKSKVFDTVEDETQFAPVPANLDYRAAIKLLRENP